MLKSDKATQLVASAFDRLAEALEQGHSDTLRAFLAAAARFHRYSFRNILLIAMQRPDASRVAGFNAWKSLGRFVKKGEKGIAIIAPMVRKGSEAGDQAETEATESTMLGFRAVYVFDVSQTDGEPLPELSRVAGDPGEYTARLKAVIASRGIVLEYAQELGGADGLSKKGTIVIREGLTPADEFSVLAHELAHEMLHQGEERSSKTVRETEAEAVAHIVSAAIGLEAGSAAVDYIRLYDGDRETLSNSLEAIQKTAQAIIEAIQPANGDPAQP